MPDDNQNVIINQLIPTPEQEEPPKPSPQCCEMTRNPNVSGGVWWEDESRMGEHERGWTMLQNCAIQIRSYWLMNVTFCPHCGTKLL